MMAAHPSTSLQRDQEEEEAAESSSSSSSSNHSTAQDSGTRGRHRSASTVTPSQRFVKCKCATMPSQREYSYNRHRPWTLSQPWLWSLIIGLSLGLLLGEMKGCPRGSSETNQTKRFKVTKRPPSFVQRVGEIPLQPTSHPGISKQAILQPFDIAANLAGLSIASIEPGKTIEKHCHPTMFEFFYILSGDGYVVLSPANSDAKAQSGSKQSLRAGDFLQTAPGDFHSFGVDDDGETKEPLRMIYFGITTD
jgi:mannose-6-phosphate isomerase-like protein (cupin superfamily)